jgi:hypothetical protein
MFLRTLFAKSSLAPATQVDPLLAFVRKIGLVVREGRLPQTTFLPGLLIEAGELVVDRRHLRYPSDILHEAGHLAVTPAAERPTLGGNITEYHPECAGDEMAVLAWSYAAAQTLGLPIEVLFHPAGYKGQSEWLIQNMQSIQPIGLPLLVWMGLTTTADFAHMVQWLRD